MTAPAPALALLGRVMLFRFTFPDPADRQCLKQNGYQSKSANTPLSSTAPENPYIITVPNNLHRLSHPSASTPACPIFPSPFPLSPIPTAFPSHVLVLVFTPYSFKQQTNGFAPGGVASSFFPSALPPTAAERWPRFASRGFSADASAALRSSRSPQRMKSFSRRVARAVGFWRRLCGRFC